MKWLSADRCFTPPWLLDRNHCRAHVRTNPSASQTCQSPFPRNQNGIPRPQGMASLHLRQGRTRSGMRPGSKNSTTAKAYVFASILGSASQGRAAAMRTNVRCRNPTMRPVADFIRPQGTKNHPTDLHHQIG